MTVSIQTNQAALGALQQLNRTTDELEKTNARISSGLQVNTSSDDPTRFAVARELKSDINAYDAVQLSLQRAVSTAEVGLASGESVSNLLIQMQDKALAATDGSLDANSRQSLQNEFESLVRQIENVVANAQFDDTNLLDGTQTPGIEFLADADAARTITLRTQNLSFNGPNITLDPVTASLNTPTAAQNALTTLQTSFENVNRSLGELSADLKQFDSHVTFIDKLRSTLDVSVGQLVDADLAEEAAKLEALQVQQQLSVQSLSIASGSPDVILSLFQN